MIETGKGAHREVKDYKLTRYACYLIAQNGDVRKEEIALAQAYFAVQTRKQEVIEQRVAELQRLQSRHALSESEKQLAGVAFERGVDSKGFAKIKSQGDKALFGGRGTRAMKRKLEACRVCYDRIACKTHVGIDLRQGDFYAGIAGSRFPR